MIWSGTREWARRELVGGYWSVQIQKTAVIKDIIMVCKVLDTRRRVMSLYVVYFPWGVRIAPIYG